MFDNYNQDNNFCRPSNFLSLLTQHKANSSLAKKSRQLSVWCWILENEWNTACTLHSMIVISAEDCGDKQKLMNMWEEKWFCPIWSTLNDTLCAGTKAGNSPKEHKSRMNDDCKKSSIPKQLSETHFRVSPCKFQVP